MKISVGMSRMDKTWKNKELSWDDFLARVRQPIRTTETVEEYRKLKKGEQDRIKDVGGFVAGHLKNGRRKNGNVICRSMLTLDMDYGTPQVWEQITESEDWQCCVYSTHKHTPTAPRLRLIIPLNREVSEDEYPALGRIVAKEIGIDLFDDTTYEPSRLMYWPSSSSNGEFVFHQQSGELLDPDKYLSKYADWKDASTWPVSSRQSEVLRKSALQQSDPLAKQGLVGAFCRAYSVEAAIDTFLQHVYAPSVMNGRYDYIPADSSAGVVLYEGKFVYSHHATDPVHGKLLNAFDVVRVHLFSALDENAKEDVPVTKLQSYKAMCELILKDDLVRELLAEERIARAKQEFTETENWQTQLELERNGSIKDTLTNISIILSNDPELQGIVFNQFKGMLDVISDLPWRQVKPGWGDADYACAKLYFERTYGLWSPAKFKDALLAVTSAEKMYHPIKDYLGELYWDGVPRLETLLIDYLGAEDTPYIRAVTTKTLCAAVARIYEPGVKFDSILVLSGVQGIGKSTLFAKLGRKWYSDSLSISDMKDKTAPEKLQGYWLLEISELAGMKKVDVETVKSFITRTDDKYRQSYGIVVESHPRSCIIVGTTNSDGGFLRDITGNRRFWPVAVQGGRKSVFDLTQDTVDLIWAEAIQKYKSGEPLYLEGALAFQAHAAQTEAMEADDREGIIENYLNRLLPDCWDTMDLYQRRSYLGECEFDGGERQGTLRREKLCMMEIWCECFGKERQNLKRTDSYEIEGILNRIGGWEKLTTNKTGKTYFPLYGPQRTFVRVASATNDNCQHVPAVL